MRFFLGIRERGDLMTISERGWLLACLLIACAVCANAQSASHAVAPGGHYLFAWTGDADKKGNDFLAVINADPQSPDYGQLVTTLATEQPTMLVHHSEYVMPEGGMLFANDFDAGRTFLFDLRDPVHPRLANTFTDVGGYSHPHSYVRLPNGHVLVSFQHTVDASDGIESHRRGASVELNAEGHFVRSSSATDPSHPDELLTPYSIVVLPAIDRVLSTDSSMETADGPGTAYQIWRLSDLKLLHTEFFDPGEHLYALADPEEPRLAPDGSVLVQTFACGLERVTGIGTDKPVAKLVYTFPGGGCGVPTIAGHFLVISDRLTHGLIVLDIANAGKPVEVSRLDLGSDYSPHWT